jgi:hypothetical protein
MAPLLGFTEYGGNSVSLGNDATAPRIPARTVRVPEPVLRYPRQVTEP